MLSAWLVIHLTDEYLMFRMNQMTTERYKVLGAVLASQGVYGCRAWLPSVA